jgi:hypothetical protein
VTQRTRILIAVVVLIVLIGVVLGVDALRRASSTPDKTTEEEPTLAPGSIPIRLDSQLVGSFSPTDLEQLEMVSFVEEEEGKIEEGWLLRDVLLLHIDRHELHADSVIIVGSSSRDKLAQVTWAEVDDPANWVMFDLAGRGTLKLVSVLDKLDTRDEWVQDVDSVEVTSQ